MPSSPTLCPRVLDVISDFVDGELDSNAVAEVEQHLERCLACASRVRFELELKRRLSGLRDRQISLPLQRRIRELLR
jgi:anti-sigma factor RsiW